MTMKCYGLGLGLNTFRMVALDANFKRLEDHHVLDAARRWGQGLGVGGGGEGEVGGRGETVR